MTDVTQQLVSAVRKVLDMRQHGFGVHPYLDTREPECNALHEMDEALTAFEASRAAPDDVVERVAQAILAKIVERKREIAGRASLEADEFDVMCAHEDARAALSALPAPDDGLEALRELSERATKGEWRPGRSDMMSSCGGCDMTFKNIYVDDPRGGVHKPTNAPLGLTVAKAVSELIGAESEVAMPDEEVLANAALIAAAVNYVRNKLAQEPRK